MTYSQVHLHGPLSWKRRKHTTTVTRGAMAVCSVNHRPGGVFLSTDKPEEVTCKSCLLRLKWSREAPLVPGDGAEDGRGPLKLGGRTTSQGYATDLLDALVCTVERSVRPEDGECAEHGALDHDVLYAEALRRLVRDSRQPLDVGPKTPVAPVIKRALLALPAHVVDAGQSVSLAVQVKSVFKGHIVRVAAHDASQIVIEDVKVGIHTQFTLPKGIDRGPFPAAPHVLRVQMDTAQPEMVVTVVVRNLGKESQVVSATIEGQTL